MGGSKKKRLKRRWMRMLSEGGVGGVYHVADIHKNKYFFYLVSFFFHYRMVNFPILYGRMFLVALSHRHHVGTDLNVHFSGSRNVYFLSKPGSHTPKYFYSKFLHSSTVKFTTVFPALILFLIFARELKLFIYTSLNS